jgi:prepilin-type processing-associated H-X9-DG protein
VGQTQLSNLENGANDCRAILRPSHLFGRRHTTTKCRKTNSPSTGLTVLELLVVTGAITMLVGLLLPAIQATREAARNVECENHLRECGLALHQHHDNHRAFPAGWTTDTDCKTAFGWAPYLLPELELSGLYSLIDFRALVYSSAAVQETTPTVFVCPSDNAEPQFELFEDSQAISEFGQESQQLLATLPQANYVAVFGVADPDQLKNGLGEGPFVRNHRFRLADITRGLGKVMFVGERTARKLPSTWIGTYLNAENAQSRTVGIADVAPNRVDTDESELDSRHPGHTNFLWGDGRVQAVADDIERNVYQDSARRN